MNEKKVTSFQFKKIPRDSLEKGKGPILKEKNKVQLSKSPPNTQKIKTHKPKTDNDLLRTLGDKEKLTLDEKLEVIDYVFKKDHKPIVICHGCGNKVTKYFISHSSKEEINFCSGCNQSLPHCDNCGMPAKILGPKLSTVYCQFCRVTKACDCCHSPITAKESNRIPFIKGTYCHTCFHKNERCVVCQIPIILEKNSFFTGGRMVCLSCHNREISVEEASKLNEAVIRHLNKRFDIKETIRCEITLTSYDILNPPNQSKSLGRFFELSGKTVLALYQGITKERAIGIFAYEYAKYLLKLLNPKLQSSDQVEGFALWLKSFVLREYSELDEIPEIKSRFNISPVLKSLWNIERLGGISRIIERIVAGEIGRK